MSVITANNISRSYGRFTALDRVSFKVEPGRIVGLVGPNGAGKTTLLKAILGLGKCEGELSVLGMNPGTRRDHLMSKVSFIADVAVMPGWMRVSQSLRFMEGIHPHFNLEKAEEYLSRTELRSKSKIKTLSKGMKTQLHLALIMAIDAELLVLDEPTLGLDILYRKAFYTDLLNEYFDEKRTILITTHQVEEVEHILTDLMFIRKGRLILDSPMDAIPERFQEVLSSPERADELRAMKPISERTVFGRPLFLFENVSAGRLQEFGETNTPGIADLFVALMKGDS